MFRKLFLSFSFVALLCGQGFAAALTPTNTIEESLGTARILIVQFSSVDDGDRS